MVALFLFLKGMTGALALFSYLVINVDYFDFQDLIVKLQYRT
jgi:hypothetical protein